jgi:hypothetical protein
VLHGSGVTPGIFSEEDLKAREPDFDSRWGLVETFTKAGYAVAFMRERGVLREKSCIKGKDFAERTKSLATHCFVKKIRRHVDLHVVTKDTGIAYRYLSKLEATRNIPIVMLGLSLGSYRIGQLIESKRIQPAGVVFVGGVFDSLASTFAYQVRQDFYFEKIAHAFAQTGKDWVSFADIVKHGNFDYRLGVPNHVPWGVGHALGGVMIRKEDVSTRKFGFEKNYQDSKAAILNSTKEQPLNGSAYAHEVTSLWSSNYMLQILQSEKRVIDQLRGYRKKVVYLYGASDAQVKIPPPEACPAPQRQCKIEVLEGVGHSLEDGTGLFLPDTSLKAILRAVDEVSQ